MGLAVGLASTAFTLGSGDTLAQVAPALPQPRISSLRRTVVALTVFSLIVTAGGAFLCVALIPAAEWPAWSAAPLSGLIHYLAGPPIVAGALAVIVADRGRAHPRTDRRRRAHRHARPAAAHRLGARIDRARHAGPPARAARQWLDAGATAIALAIVVSGGGLAWLAYTYAACAVVRLLIKTSALIRLRARRPSPLAFRVPLNVRIAGRTWPLGLITLQILLGVMVAGDDPRGSSRGARRPRRDRRRCSCCSRSRSAARRATPRPRARRDDRRSGSAGAAHRAPSWRSIRSPRHRATSSSPCAIRTCSRISPPSSANTRPATSSS